MQQQTTFSPGMTIHDRYHIEGVLGEGGFSTVYLVRDLCSVGEQETFFALKELRNQDKNERARFLFEGELLKRLTHQALPHIYDIFEDQKAGRVFMLLEYIQGPNLERLRRQQLDQRFSLSSMLDMMHSVIDAVTYLHSQQPPIIHRDIKPANIIVPQTGERTVLVDLGIAKEYEVDATTTAVRHCSPGYGAPEQYSGVGTDPRTDIYGLGATCYALLTGVTPADAFYRTTALVSKKIDPLVPVNKLAPTISVHVTQAIAQAMSIGQEGRFSSVEDFWQALHAQTDGEETLEQTAPPVSRLPAHSIKIITAQAIHPIKYALVIFLLIILLGLSSTGIISRASMKNTYRPHGSPVQSARITATARAAATASHTAQPHYAVVASTYSGKVYDVGTNTPTPMFLTEVQQENERLSGSFAGLQVTGTFTGVLDTSQHIFLTVAGTADHPPFFFQGTVKTDGSLAGNYCNLDATGQCTGGYGVWSLMPGSVPRP